jgi:hypothetical protein
MLASKSGNEPLEQILVRMMGFECKPAGGKKHGADSACGNVEAKPMKTEIWNAHISDDSGNSLLQHQTIPFIVFGQATEDGQKILWTLVTSYRIFDKSRFKALVGKCIVPGSEGAEAFTSLPEGLEERWNVLSDLQKKWSEKGGSYKNNRLPISDVEKLQPGMYQVWVNPELKKAASEGRDISPDQRRILALEARQKPMTADFIDQTTKTSAYFKDKLNEAKATNAQQSALKKAAARVAAALQKRTRKSNEHRLM